MVSRFRASTSASSSRQHQRRPGAGWQELGGIADILMALSDDPEPIPHITVLKGLDDQLDEAERAV
jgi:hypothetical protein